MAPRLHVVAVTVLLALAVPAWTAPLFQTSSKELGDGKMDLRKLARERGTHYIAKIDEHPKPGRMLVGFLRDAGDDPAALGPEFANVRRPEGVLELDQFAPLCGFLQ